METQHSAAVSLAEWVCNLKLDDVSEQVEEKTRSCILDWLGSAYSGSIHPTAQLYINLAKDMGGLGKEAIIGKEETCSLPMSIFVNGAFGHISETDDGHRASIMHPGSVVVPVALGLAHLAKNPGKALMEGVIAGYEVAIRVGEALGPGHYAKWHTTATAGVFGAAATAAKMLELSKEQVVSALGIAGTQAAGLWQFLDDGCLNAKPFHPAKACFDGYMSAIAAKNGLSGAWRIFEGKKGLLSALASPPLPEYLTAKLGEGFKIMEANFKAYPTCGQTHSMIDALDRLCLEHQLTPKSVKSISARVYERAMQVAGNLDPKSLEEAKFSIPFCMAYRLVHGAIPFSGLDEHSVSDAEVRAVMKKISIVVDPEMSAGFPAARPCVVEITCNDERLLSCRNLYRKGDPESPMSFEQVAAKFRDLTQVVLSPPVAEKIIQVSRTLPFITKKDLDALYSLTKLTC
ncbi:MmgE/PrpD family protein [Desulfovibrio litoralis]|uniref:2-methylcitrate dehydratase PrpD n=1 Tax=Desulfovibrio litoralis DSM 11393 TaxID=1121455 RepID=A0A1M7SH24_9BACT|nr:MmgE/PrpD family protein [Desulfovibrio litoralis]SHN57662.1 2-methylcitrate dehydratase PrpD [Desulfovibrio litoralis DSM 11393]